MKSETQGWGDSVVATRYIYDRLHTILDMDIDCDTNFALSKLLDELAHNYKIDTGNEIAEEL